MPGGADEDLPAATTNSERHSLPEVQTAGGEGRRGTAGYDPSRQGGPLI